MITKVTLLNLIFVILDKNMLRKTQLYIISILLTITALVMIFLGIKASILPPTLTGMGFLLIVWALFIFNKNKDELP